MGRSLIRGGEYTGCYRESLATSSKAMELHKVPDWTRCGNTIALADRGMTAGPTLDRTFSCCSRAARAARNICTDHVQGEICGGRHTRLGPWHMPAFSDDRKETHPCLIRLRLPISCSRGVTTGIGRQTPEQVGPTLLAARGFVRSKFARVLSLPVLTR